MREPDGWKKVADGSFTGQLTLTVSHHYENATKSVRLLAVGKDRVVSLIEERVENGRITGWQTRRLTGSIKMSEAHFLHVSSLNEVTVPEGVVIGLGQDNRLYRFQEAEGRWYLLDRGAQFPTNALTMGYGTIIGRGLNNQIWHGTPEGFDIGWENLGGNMHGRPTPSAGNHFLARGVDGTLQINNGGRWDAHADNLAGNPVFAYPFYGLRDAPHYLILARGNDNVLWSRKIVADYSVITATPQVRVKDRVSLGITIQGNPACAVMPYSKLYCVVRGSDNHLYCVPCKGGVWGAWSNWGGGLASDPVATILYKDDPSGHHGADEATLRAFAIGEDGSLWEQSYRFLGDELSPREDVGVTHNNSATDDNYIDDTNVEPGEIFIKKWAVTNTGDSTWTEDFRFDYLQKSQHGMVGKRMGSAESTRLNTVVRPGETTQIAVRYIAPQQPGKHVSWRQMQAPDGTPFGTTPYVRINVQ